MHDFNIIDIVGTNRATPSTLLNLFCFYGLPFHALHLAVLPACFLL
jgi:hypothetical protein